MFVIDGVETTTLGMRFDLYQYMGCIDINFAIYFEKKKRKNLTGTSNIKALMEGLVCVLKGKRLSWRWLMKAAFISSRENISTS